MGSYRPRKKQKMSHLIIFFKSLILFALYTWQEFLGLIYSMDSKCHIQSNNYIDYIYINSYGDQFFSIILNIICLSYLLLIMQVLVYYWPLVHEYLNNIGHICTNILQVLTWEVKSPRDSVILYKSVKHSVLPCGLEIFFVKGVCQRLCNVSTWYVIG